MTFAGKGKAEKPIPQSLYVVILICLRKPYLFFVRKIFISHTWKYEIFHVILPHGNKPESPFFI